MKKIYFFFLIFSIFSFSSTIQNKISINQNKLKKETRNKTVTSLEIEKLALEINKEEKKFNAIENKLNIISNNIFLNKIKLKSAKKNLIQLNNKSKKLKINTKEIEEKIVNSIVENYSISLSKSLINKESLADIVNKEKYSLILDISKDKILKSNIKYFKVQNDKRDNIIKTKNIKIFIENQIQKKEEFNALKNKQYKSVLNLKNKHKLYQKTLKSIIKKQRKLNVLLNDLSILKKKKKRKESLKNLKNTLKKQEDEKKKKLKKLKNVLKKKIKEIKISQKTNKSSNSKNIKEISKQILQEDIDLSVKNIGSSIKGIKISNYRGRKTIAPLKSYKVIKKFGKYFDSIYKIELFNESISLKSKIKNAKVHSVLRGKVVYAKTDAGTLGNVVIVKHKNALHTVYSQLSNIPKSLKVGKWIPKGYVVGRIKDTLIFQATKNNRYINPIKLFK